MKKINQSLNIIKQDFPLFLSICFGIFLFVLFFEPFDLFHLDFNNRLLFVSGYAGIIFLFMVIIRIAFRWNSMENANYVREPVLPNYLGGFLLLVLTTVATTFYTRYAGFIPLSFYLVFKITLINLAPPVALWLFDSFSELRMRNLSLINEKESIEEKFHEHEKDKINSTIMLSSDHNEEGLQLNISDIILLKSAGNYVEIMYLKQDSFKKLLIRNTLKNLENQLKPFPDFIRCHRTYVVNISYIQKIHRKFSNVWIEVNHYDDSLPVSRQYLLKLKEKLNNPRG